ncbi:MAG TPA: DUF1638 domain-containing protein [Negativicutes bacterium]|jgi:hypothetical protein
MPIKIVACEVMKEELLAVTADSDIEFEFISMGLHLYPEKLGKELQQILNGLTGYSRVILAFGLCGGAAKNLKTVRFTLTIPRVHDCIPLLLGSKAAYEKFHQEETGTLYLSCGWMNGERTILSEYDRIYKKYGEKKATGLFKRMYSGYQRALFIRTGSAVEPQCLQRSHQVAALLGLSHQITQGDTSFIKKIVKGPWSTADFINVPPGGTVDEWAFYDGKLDTI